MLMQNFYSYLERSASSLRRSDYDLIGYVQALKYMPALICMALFFSSNSHSESTEGGYSKLEYKADYHQDTVELKFSGNPPKSIDGLPPYFPPYTNSFNIKIGENEYPLDVSNNYTQLVSRLKLKDLNYNVHKFPKTELVFSYRLSVAQFFLESYNCISVHSSWSRIWWEKFSNFKLQACWKKVRGVFTQRKYYSFDITGLLLPHIQSEIKKRDADTKKLIKDGNYKLSALVMYGRQYRTFSKDQLNDKDYLQNLAAFGQATRNYFERNSTTLMEAYEKQILSENMLSNTRHLEDAEKQQLLQKAVGPFESKQCEDELPNNLPITLGNPRLPEATKNLASDLCQYNPISFNQRASNPPTKPGKYNEHAATGINKENSTFLPYVFCDKYTCVIHSNENFYWRLSWHQHFSGMLFKKNIDHIRQYLLFKSKVPVKLSDCSNYCTISNNAALMYEMIKLEHKTRNKYKVDVSWIIKMHMMQLN